MNLPPAQQLILKHTARSFYLSLQFATPQLRPALSLGYLFCRAADTLADTDAVEPAVRVHILDDFSRIMCSFPPHFEELGDFMSKWQKHFSPAHPLEKKLLENIPSMVSLFQKLSKTEQALIQNVISGVIRGMKMDLQFFPPDQEGVNIFKTEKELESYLTSIGGEPGRFWSQLNRYIFPEIKIKNESEWIQDGIQFGMGLQMVNILRDLPEDLSRGRCYIPESLLNEHHLTLQDITEKNDPSRFLTLYHELISTSTNRLEHGLLYLQQIPKKYFRLRAPVWWPLEMGLKTLEALRNESDILNLKKKVKIKRRRVFTTMATSIISLNSDYVLQRIFNNFAKKLR